MHSRSIVALLATLGLCGIALAAGTMMVRPGQMQKIVEVRDVHMHADRVTGVLENVSSKPVRNLQIRIEHSWLWTNERHPGEDDPGRSVLYMVPAEIAPGGRLPFTYRLDAPLPERPDGRFETSVSVVDLEQVG